MSYLLMFRSGSASTALISGAAYLKASTAAASSSAAFTSSYSFLAAASTLSFYVAFNIVIFILTVFV
jgi:hypothetical protein